MNKKPLIIVSICAVMLLVLASLGNVMGYQTVQTSQQKLIKERINKRELLFQTIVDIANNKEIQRIILKSQMSRGIFPISEIPVITKNQLKQMYLVGLMFSKFISKSIMHSIIDKYQLNNQGVQKEITVIVEKDDKLDEEMRQLSNSDCDCENGITIGWNFPIICTLLRPIYNFFFLLWFTSHQDFFYFFVLNIEFIFYKLNCSWT